MQTYWDLTEKERAALSYEGVQRYVDAELMLKGVLAVPELELAPVPDMPTPDVVVYRPKASARFGGFDVAFATDDQARAFLELKPFHIVRDWQLGDAQIADRLDDARIEIVPAFTRAAADIFRSKLESIKAAKDENDRRKRARDEQQKKVDQALAGLWEDWHACCAKARKVAAINATREKYLKLAGGDEATAARFLAMVHSEAELAEAAEWGGDKPTPSAVPAAPTNVNEIPF